IGYTAAVNFSNSSESEKLIVASDARLRCFRLEPPNQIEPIQPLPVLETVVEGARVPVAVVADLRADLEHGIELVRVADRVARVVAGEAITRAVLVIHPFVPESDEVLLRKCVHRVIEKAEGRREAGDCRSESAARIELKGPDAGCAADRRVALP